MLKKCKLLWREAHVEVKMHKAHHVRTTFGSCDVEKVHAVVARSTFASEKGKNTSRSDHFWKLRCLKSARGCGSKNVQNTTWTRHFWTFRCRFAWQAQGIVDLAKSEQNVRVFVALMAGVGHLKRICKDTFSVAGAVQETSSSELFGRSGR